MRTRPGIAIVAIAVVAVSLPATTIAGELAREWLDRMHAALDELNYVGTFVRIIDGDVESLRVTHRYDNEGLYERIVLLDGVGREIIRHDDEVRVIYPDERTVRHDVVLASNPMVAGSLPSYSRSLEPHYELREFDTDRVAGRKTQKISIKPRDNYRYGYLLWLDWETAMPLRSRSWNDEEQILEEIIFTSIEYPDTLPDAAFEQTTDSTGFAEMRSSRPQHNPAPEEPWTVEELPGGFQLTASMLKSVANSDSLIEHRVYSDGLATVSVFIDSADTQTDITEGFWRVGSTNAYSLRKDGRRITAVGEVPPRTVESIATSLREH